MRKLFILVFFVGIAFMSCSKCSTDKTPAVENDSVNTEITVEDMISADSAKMSAKYGDNYRWYETCIRLPEYLDSGDATSDPEMVVNVFQSIEEFESGADTYVWKFQHLSDGTILTDSIHSFWIEDFPLHSEDIKLNYIEAFDRMLQANAPKPHSKNVILRSPIGPVEVNAQWVFGNISEQIWVDAVTGNVGTSNPAFPDSLGFKMPLGEWP